MGGWEQRRMNEGRVELVGPRRWLPTVTQGSILRAESQGTEGDDLWFPQVKTPLHPSRLSRENSGAACTPSVSFHSHPSRSWPSSILRVSAFRSMCDFSTCLSTIFQKEHQTEVWEMWRRPGVPSSLSPRANARLHSEPCIFLSFFFFKCIDLFIWLHGALATAVWILSCGPWDLVLGPGIELRPPALGTRSLNCWTSNEVLSPASSNNRRNKLCWWVLQSWKG